MKTIRQLAVAIERYATDNNIYPTAATMHTLEGLIEPIYIQTTPTTDGWGNALLVESDTVGYRIVSLGQDGELNPEAGGASSDPDSDIVFVDGQFVQWHESR